MLTASSLLGPNSTSIKRYKTRVDEEKPKRISTRLIQSMEILQMTLNELEVHVDLELSNNYCLDYKEVGKTQQYSKKADAWIAKGPNGNYRVEVAPLIRELAIKDEMKQRSSQEEDSETGAFLKRLINQAHWLIESVNARKQTLTKVIQEIIRHQSHYIETGEAKDLVGLKMETIAEAAGIHVTTVSRAVLGKSLETVSYTHLTLPTIYSV